MNEGITCVALLWLTSRLSSVLSALDAMVFTLSLITNVHSIYCTDANSCEPNFSASIILCRSRIGSMRGEILSSGYLGHNVVHVQYNLVNYHAKEEIQRFRTVYSSPSCFIVSFFIMALRMYGLEQALELVTTGDDDEENLSDDEMVGDFVTDSGQNVVLSGDTLSRASDMSVSLPDPSEMDSLLLDDTGGNGGDSS